MGSKGWGGVVWGVVGSRHKTGKEINPNSPLLAERLSLHWCGDRRSVGSAPFTDLYLASVCGANFKVAGNYY